MASLATAALPSSDEEDDDYDPCADPTGDKEPGDKRSGRKRRGRSASAAADAPDAARNEAAAAAPDDDAGPAPGGDEAPAELTPAQTAKKARIDSMWQQLQQASTGSVNKLSKSSISLASLCSSGAATKKRRTSDALWMRNLGITPKRGSAGRPSGASAASTPGSGLAAAAAAAAAADSPATRDGAAAERAAGSSPAATGATAAEPAGPSSAAGAEQAAEQPRASSRSPAPDVRAAAAAAALAAAREGASGGVARSYNKVTLTETRRFAGKDIQVTVTVDKDSREAKCAADKASAAAAGASGLDSFLQQIEGKKKVTVLDKSKMDWRDFKTTDTAVQEELEAHARSDKQYLDKQDFLKRSELREYEIERDKRLASDVRLRGRL